LKCGGDGGRGESLFSRIPAAAGGEGYESRAAQLCEFSAKKSHTMDGAVGTGPAAVEAIHNYSLGTWCRPLTSAQLLLKSSGNDSSLARNGAGQLLQILCQTIGSGGGGGGEQNDEGGGEEEEGELLFHELEFLSWARYF
jgi:hypothetical protein